MNDQALIAALNSNPLFSNHDATGSQNVPMADDVFSRDLDTTQDLHRLVDDGCPHHHE